jgi:hypothetical protein
LICGRGRDDGIEGELDELDGVDTSDERGVLKAPVDKRWSFSNSSCSLGGRRGGAGPVEKAGRVTEVEKKWREGKGKRRGRSRDIVLGDSLLRSLSPHVRVVRSVDSSSRKLSQVIMGWQ